jgi:hypothetical protein
LEKVDGIRAGRVDGESDECTDRVSEGGITSSSQVCGYVIALLTSISFFITSADLDLSKVLDVFKVLTLTYPRYADGPSREAVENVGMELVRRDELRGTEKGAIDEQKMGVTEQILGWLSNEVSRLSKRGSARCVP